MKNLPITGKDIARAATVLEADGVVAIPTETVYGLAGNIFSRKAIDKIYSIKKRPRSNPLIVHVSSVRKAKELVKSFPATAELLARNFWPGPLTMVLPKKKIVGDWLTAKENTVAIRIPDHPITLKLLRRLHFPLAAPSANPFKYISPVSAKQVKKMLGNKVVYILDGGRSKRGIESTIVSFEKDGVKILRPGAITEEQLEKVLQEPLLKSVKKKSAHPGMFKKHYSPHTPLFFTDDVLKFVGNKKQDNVAVLSFCKKHKLPHDVKQIVLSKKGLFEEAAANLYDALHQLDNGKFKLIIAEKAPDTGLGKAINERLKKASVK